MTGLAHISRSLILLIVLVASSSWACNKSPSDTAVDRNRSVVITSSVPPFKTTEPQQYHATRIVTTTESRTGKTPTVRSSSTFIARQGGERYTEYSTESGQRIGCLEHAGDTFVLLPELKLYAHLDFGSAQDSEGSLIDSTEATASLLDQSEGETSYEKMGTELLNDHQVTRYRATYVSNPGADLGGRQETFIWIDDALGMPIKSETTYLEAGRSARVVNELREISLTVDPGVFRVPAAYQKVEYSRIIEWIRNRRSK